MKQKLQELKEMAELLNQFLNETEQKELGIKEEMVIDFLYNGLKPYIGRNK